MGQKENSAFYLSHTLKKYARTATCLRIILSVVNFVKYILLEKKNKNVFADNIKLGSWKKKYLPPFQDRSFGTGWVKKKRRLFRVVLSVPVHIGPQLKNIVPICSSTRRCTMVVECPPYGWWVFGVQFDLLEKSISANAEKSVDLIPSFLAT